MLCFVRPSPSSLCHSPANNKAPLPREPYRVPEETSSLSEASLNLNALEALPEEEVRPSRCVLPVIIAKKCLYFLAWNRMEKFRQRNPEMKNIPRE